jgi:hypothetical protein
LDAYPRLKGQQEGDMERRIAIVVAAVLFSWAALYAVDVKLFDSALTTALLSAVPIS